jgi:hypothetical protein
LASPNGIVDIFNNATGCNNPPEVANACGISLPCLPYGDYYFLSQADIDNFQTNYPNCTELEGYVEISGLDITSLNGLSVITSIGGGIEILGNDVLTNLTGLDNLTSIGGGLGIQYNAVLKSLTGLDNIDTSSISYLYVTDNYSLSTCAVQSICDYLASPNNHVEIYSNAPGCNSPEEVDSACVYLSTEELNLKPAFSIYPNPAYTQITLEISAPPTKHTFLTLYNLNGQQLVQQQITERTTGIDISTLPQGVYFVRMASERTVVVGKIIKQ